MCRWRRSSWITGLLLDYSYSLVWHRIIHTRIHHKSPLFIQFLLQFLHHPVSHTGLESSRGNYGCVDGDQRAEPEFSFTLFMFESCWICLTCSFMKASVTDFHIIEEGAISLGGGRSLSVVGVKGVQVKPEKWKTSLCFFHYLSVGGAVSTKSVGLKFDSTCRRCVAVEDHYCIMFSSQPWSPAPGEDHDDGTAGTSSWNTFPL